MKRITPYSDNFSCIKFFCGQYLCWLIRDNRDGSIIVQDDSTSGEDAAQTYDSIDAFQQAHQDAHAVGSWAPVDDYPDDFCATYGASIAEWLKARAGFHADTMQDLQVCPIELSLKELRLLISAAESMVRRDLPPNDTTPKRVKRAERLIEVCDRLDKEIAKQLAADDPLLPESAYRSRIVD